MYAELIYPIFNFIPLGECTSPKRRAQIKLPCYVIAAEITAMSTLHTAEKNLYEICSGICGEHAQLLRS